jgi:hypothetical protein
MTSPAIGRRGFVRIRRLYRLGPGRTDSLWIWAGLGLVHVLSVKRYVKHFRFSRDIMFLEVTSISICLVLVTQRITNNMVSCDASCAIYGELRIYLKSEAGIVGPFRLRKERNQTFSDIFCNRFFQKHFEVTHFTFGADIFVPFLRCQNNVRWS